MTPLSAILSLSTFFCIPLSIPAVSFLYLVFSSFKLLALLVYTVWEFLFVLVSTCVIFSDIFAVFLLIYTTIWTFPSLFFSIHFFFVMIALLFDVIVSNQCTTVMYMFPLPLIPRIRFLILSCHTYI